MPEQGSLGPTPGLSEPLCPGGGIKKVQEQPQLLPDFAAALSSSPSLAPGAAWAIPQELINPARAPALPTVPAGKAAMWNRQGDAGFEFGKGKI